MSPAAEIDPRVGEALAPTLAMLDGGAPVSAGPDGSESPAPDASGPAVAPLTVGDLVAVGAPDQRHGRIVDQWISNDGEAMVRVVAGVRRRTENRRFRYDVIHHTIALNDLDLTLTVQVRHDPYRTDHLVASLLIAAADELERKHRHEFDTYLSWALALDRAVREVGR